MDEMKRLLAAAAIVAGASGCASDGNAPRETGRIISLSEFSAPRAHESAPASSAPSSHADSSQVGGSHSEAPATAPAAAASRGAEAASQAGDPARPGESVTSATPSTAEGQAPAADRQPPTASSSPPLRPGEPVIVERLVGQVSGRPIFASEILAPIADRLRSEAQQLPPREFAQQAMGIVNAQINMVVLNELFIAEAEASLTPEEEQGVLYMMRKIQEGLIAENLGSRSRATNLLGEAELTVEEVVEFRRNEMLIGKLISEKIRPRVIVSWKDVQREYELRKGEFNPPQTVTFRQLRLPTEGQGAVIEDLKARFARGESFEAVAASLEPASVRTMDPEQMGAAGISDVNLNPAYTDALEGLNVGDTTAPVVVGGNTVWLHVQSIDQPPARSLFDVQREIITQLTQRRELEERLKFTQSLFAKGIYDELDQMSQRVLAMALLTYGR